MFSPAFVTLCNHKRKKVVIEDASLKVMITNINKQYKEISMKSVKFFAFGLASMLAVAANAEVAATVDVLRNGQMDANISITQLVVVNETETQALVTFSVVKTDEAGNVVISQPEVLVNFDEPAHLFLASQDETLDITVTANKVVVA